MKFLELFGKFDIGEPPWDYDFLLNLEESEYPKYLAKIFNYRTDEKLPLHYDWKKRAWVIDKNKCKTFNQKIQWLKLYDATPLKKMCTDKVLVRDYVAEKIGEEYLKPVLQVCDNVEEIDWDNLPNQIAIKASNGCKWQYLIIDKELLLNHEKPLLEEGKRSMAGWLKQNYSFWGGFEMQYHGLKPKILIEDFMKASYNIHIYCFNGKPKIIITFFHSETEDEICIYDENLNIKEFGFEFKEKRRKINAGKDVKLAVELVKTLVKPFKFVRADWMIFKSKLYFEELTFTPYSGFYDLGKSCNRNLGELLKI